MSNANTKIFFPMVGTGQRQLCIISWCRHSFSGMRLWLLGYGIAEPLSAKTIFLQPALCACKLLHFLFIKQICSETDLTSEAEQLHELETSFLVHAKSFLFIANKGSEIRCIRLKFLKRSDSLLMNIAGPNATHEQSSGARKHDVPERPQ